MRILMVSSFLPHPLTSGGHVRLYNILKRLAKNHEITLVAEMRENQTEDDIAALKKFCKEVYTVKRKKQWTIANILSAFFSLHSFLVVGHTQPKMKEIIAQLLTQEKFDCIDVETYYVLQNLPETKLPIVLVEHNIEYDAYQQFAQNVFPLARFLFAWDTWKMKREEQAAWRKAKRLVAVSSLEAKRMGRSDIVIAPNGVDTDTFKPIPVEKKFAVQTKKILFIGVLKWIQNSSSLTYILKEIWPKLFALCKEKKIDISLWVVGKEIPENIRTLGSEGVFFDEHADNTVDVFSSSHVLLFPVTIAAGTSLKMIEAMAAGTPIVTSPLGIRGLDLAEGKNVLLADSTQSFVEKTMTLLTNEKMYGEIAKSAQSVAQTHYSWDSIVSHLEKEVFARI